MIWFVILNLIISCRSIRNVNFASVHSLWSYMKDLISLNINNLYILHCNDPLEPQWWLMWFNGIGRWKNFAFLLETILVPTHWALIVLIKNRNMSHIDLLSFAHCLYMNGILGVHPCARVKSSLHLIWNVVWHLYRRRIARDTILFIGRT